MGRPAAFGGFSLIEVLIATGVFSVGMSGMAALMLAAAGGMAEAERETVVHLGGAAMSATLQLGPAALEHLANPPASVPLCFEDRSCTHEDWILGRYLMWRARVRAELPNGEGVVCRDSTPMDGDDSDPACDGTGPVAVKVFWREPRHAHDEDGGIRRAVQQVPW